MEDSGWSGTRKSRHWSSETAWLVTITYTYNRFKPLHPQEHLIEDKYLSSNVSHDIPRRSGNVRNFLTTSQIPGCVLAPSVTVPSWLQGQWHKLTSRPRKQGSGDSRTDYCRDKVILVCSQWSRSCWRSLWTDQFRGTGKEGVLVLVDGRNISVQFQATRGDKGYRSEDMAWLMNVSGLARTNNAAWFCGIH